MLVHLLCVSSIIEDGGELIVSWSYEGLAYMSLINGSYIANILGSGDQLVVSCLVLKSVNDIR